MLSRLLRPLLSATAVAALATSVAAPLAGSEVPAPVPVRPPAGPPEARYAVARQNLLAAERTAAEHGHTRRSEALRAMANPARRFLFFDGRDEGRSAEVFGDLTAAGRVAVLVPGTDTSLDRYGRLRADALALQRELGGRAAVIAWLGYRTPGTLSTALLTTDRADEAAPALQALVRELGPARVSLLCHSYGAVVCGRAAPGWAAWRTSSCTAHPAPAPPLPCVRPPRLGRPRHRRLDRRRAPRAVQPALRHAGARPRPDVARGGDPGLPGGRRPSQRLPAAGLPIAARRRRDRRRDRGRPCVTSSSASSRPRPAPGTGGSTGCARWPSSAWCSATGW
ncbi:alpha/beta hydrolase [Nonomuraea antimicrobica]